MFNATLTRQHQWITARAPRLLGLASLALLLSGCGGGGGGGSADADPSTAATPTTTTPSATPGTSPSSSPTTTASSNPGTNPLSTGLDPSTTEIKLLVLKSSGVSTLYADPELRITHLVNFSNRVLTDSGVNLALTVAQIEDVAYPDGLDIETALNDLTSGTHLTLVNVASMREAAEADLVVFMRPYANDGRCGIAWIGGYLSNGDLSNSGDFGYSVVSPNCSDYTLLHELGHNLGLGHSREEGDSAGSFDYGRGYGVDGGFATVMADPSHYAATRVPRLSSPLTDCLGAPCGVSHSDPTQGADAVRAVQQTMDQVAAYQP